ncbi:hypothetical protein OUZ56_024128 [Daphnia magna]|uniref:Uncharacterized protein n=1 Tax=Daphnia magna TaxID=35525 RepID=A0ABR0B077_9CRUS|nr:hypothetical protein OUZ56_024128 [Daphnia magna]
MQTQYVARADDLEHTYHQQLCDIKHDSELQVAHWVWLRSRWRVVTWSCGRFLGVHLAYTQCPCRFAIFCKA